MKMLLFLLCLLLMPVAAFAAPDASAFVGDWMGTLDAGGQKLRLAVHLKRDADGTWRGTLDSIDQGANGIPVDTVRVEGATLTLVLNAIRGGYKGTLSDAGTINGNWSQGGLTLPLDFARSNGEAQKPRRPQEPKAPLPYRAEEVTFAGGGPGVTLAATLTLPEGKGPFPAVLLITGSGPQDRDETVMAHRPFLVLADFLTRRGIAVLRADDRGVGKSTGDFSVATTADFAADAAAGVAFLKSRPGIDPMRIGLVGHSEGGVVAPLVATQSRDVAFLVLMAGIADNIEDILRAQSRLIMKANGIDDGLITLNDGTIASACAVVRAGGEPDSVNARIDRSIDSMLVKMTPEQRAYPGATRAELVATAHRLNTPWFRWLLAYDAKATLRRVTVPVLAVNGSLDLQVPPEQLDKIAIELRAGGNKRVETALLPGLNHLFQTAVTGAPTEYATIEETMSPAVLEKVAAWISGSKK